MDELDKKASEKLRAATARLRAKLDADEANRADEVREREALQRRDKISWCTRGATLESDLA